MTKEEHLELHKRAMECGRLFYLQTEESLDDIKNTRYKTTFTKNTPEEIKKLNELIKQQIKQNVFTVDTTTGVLPWEKQKI